MTKDRWPDRMAQRSALVVRLRTLLKGAGMPKAQAMELANSGAGDLLAVNSLPVNWQTM
jgi:hypothetical protein